MVWVFFSLLLVSRWHKSVSLEVCSVASLHANKEVNQMYFYLALKKTSLDERTLQVSSPTRKILI